MGTKLLEASIGRDSGALKGSRSPPSFGNKFRQKTVYLDPAIVARISSPTSIRHGRNMKHDLVPQRTLLVHTVRGQLTRSDVQHISRRYLWVPKNRAARKKTDVFRGAYNPL